MASQDPERTRTLLDRFYDAVSEEIERAGGTLEKFVGDAVCAVFGVPAAQEDHVERALHAALAVRRMIDELFETLQVRVGVNTGEVVVAPSREQSSFVTGLAVNLAARLEQAAAPGEILVGERVADLAAGAFEFDEPTTIDAKGAGEIVCRRLVRALALTRPRGIPGLTTAFVGRERELARAREALERTVRDRKPQLVTVMGEAGVGKTRLVRELWAWLAHEWPTAVRRTGRCPPYGRAVTYQPIAEMLREHFGLPESDPPERVLEHLGGRKILALSFGLDVAGDTHPIVARDRLHDAFLGFVGELASERPVALLVEDLHWAEEPLLQVLERMLVELDGPVLLVATARPELLDRSPTWGRGRMGGEWIWLEPLGPGDVETLITALVSDDVPEPIRELLARAEGNPLFLEELLATLVERGALTPGQRWNPQELPEAAVPDTVRAVLASRMDLLASTDKRALQAAAVVGRTFSPSAVRHLVGEVVDLHVLEQHDFVRRSPGSSVEGEYAFKHALTRDAAYASLTVRTRARLHGGYAEWLEGRGGADTDAAALAYHYAEAVDPAASDLAWADDAARQDELRHRAVTWLRRAARLAVGRYELEDALALLTQAAPLARDRHEKIAIHRELANVHRYRYDASAFRAELEHALELGPEPREAAEIYSYLAYYALGRPYMWREPPPGDLAQRWLASALELSEPETAARGWARVAHALSDPVARIEAADEAEAIGRSLDQPVLVSFAGEARALAATEDRRFQEACVCIDQALTALPAADESGHGWHHRWNAAFVYLRAGRLEEARRFADQFSEIAPSLTAHEEVHAIGLQVVIECALGRWETLAELADRAEAVVGANTDFPCQFNWRTLLMCALGLAHAQGEHAARRLTDGIAAGPVVGGPIEREPALLRLALLRGDDESARRILDAVPAMGGAFVIDTEAARLDALSALGDVTRVEEEAAPFLGEESYTHPFALRALAIMRRDPSLVKQAAEAFERIGLAWRAEETEALTLRRGA